MIAKILKKFEIKVTGVVCSFAGLFLLITSALFTVAIVREYGSENKYGPLTKYNIAESDDNSVRYEFGACLYVAYTFG